MATRSKYNALLPVRALQAQTISTSAINTGDEDLRGYDSCLIVVDIGAIDGLGSGSPTAGTIQVLVEHADDDGTGSAGDYANVADTDLDGDTQSSGVVHTFDEDNTTIYRVAYIGSRRFIRVTLTPAGLGSGGPAGVWLIKGHAHLEPAS